MKTRYRRLKGLDEFPTPVRKPARKRRSPSKVLATGLLGIALLTVALKYGQSIINAGYQTQPLPLSGQGWASQKFERSPKNASLTILTGNSNSLIRLYAPNTDQEVISVMVRAHDSRNFPVPAGSYILRIARGKTWYGQQHLFGRTTDYQRAIGLISVSPRTQHVLDISENRGNLPMTPDTPD